MFRYALALASATGAGLRLKETVARRLQSTIIIVLACLLFFIAVIFGLIAAYHALLGAGLTGAQSAGLVAAGLVLAALLLLALLPLLYRRHRNRLARALQEDGAAGAVGAVDEQLGQVIKQVGPIGVLAAAFAIGMLAARR